EELPPEQLMSLMITYLTEMTDILMNHGGLLDKYVGDAIVGMFGGLIPTENHAYQAVAAAIAIQRRQKILREQWRKEGIWPESVCHMRTRIGINTGEAIVGNMGSNRRFNYTMIGDAVNLAARCESGAKSYGIQTLVTGETRVAAITFKDDVVYRYIDRIVVQGRSTPVDVIEVVGFKSDVPENVMECIRLYDEGVRAYLEQSWDEAAGKFSLASRIEALQPGVDRGASINPSIVMLQRVEYMKANPPEAGWSGVYRMESK
ncbi:MAG: adenylate/guanylate cyclase domain-containing protein, partial [Verrucomicrobiales bacterium]